MELSVFSPDVDLLFSLSFLSGFAGKTENHRMLGLF